MRVDRLLILTLAAFMTAGEAFAVMHATASLDNPRDTSQAKPPVPNVVPRPPDRTGE